MSWLFRICLFAVVGLWSCVPDTDGFAVGDVDGGEPDAGALDAGAEDSGEDDLDASRPDGLVAVSDAMPDMRDAAMDATSNDGGSPPDASQDDGGGDDGPSPEDAERPDVMLPDAMSCRPTLLPCLDASDPDVIEIPTEGLTEVFDSAMPGQIIQVRARTLVGITWVPPVVTVRGCEGARVDGNLAFEGNGGVVEGFIVRGTVAANQTGTFVIRDNIFEAGASGSPMLAATSRDALVSADVDAIVERNLFRDAAVGIHVGTRYDTMTHRVTISVRNNIFERVDEPIWISEAGLVGEIHATVEHNTFSEFRTAIDILATERRTVLRANLFAHGDRAVRSDSVYDGPFNMYWDLTEAHNLGPISGGFVEIPATFVEEEASDYRLLPGSLALDAVPSTTINSDYYDCLRPVAFSGTVARADVGAIEVAAP